MTVLNNIYQYSQRLYLSVIVSMIVYLAPVGEAKYCDDRVCLSVCLSASISPELHVRSSLIFMHVTYVRGSVLLWKRTLCISRLWMTSYLHDITGHMHACRCNTGTGSQPA